MLSGWRPSAILCPRWVVVALLPALPSWVGSAGVGRLEVLRQHTTDNCVINVFRRLSGSWAVTIPLAPAGRLDTLYLRPDGPLWVAWYLIPHTQIRTVQGAKYNKLR